MNNMNLNYTHKEPSLLNEFSNVYTENAVIRPPIKFKHHQKQKNKFKIIIDSRDRNISIWSSPSKYWYLHPK